MIASSAPPTESQGSVTLHLHTGTFLADLSLNSVIVALTEMDILSTDQD